MSATAASNQSRLFLVVDIYQIVLVEPDSKRLGWGVAIFAGFLQGDRNISYDSSDCVSQSEDISVLVLWPIWLFFGGFALCNNLKFSSTHYYSATTWKKYHSL